MTCPCHAQIGTDLLLPPSTNAPSPPPRSDRKWREARRRAAGRDLLHAFSHAKRFGLKTRALCRQETKATKDEADLKRLHSPLDSAGSNVVFSSKAEKKKESGGHRSSTWRGILRKSKADKKNARDVGVDCRIISSRRSTLKWRNSSTQTELKWLMETSPVLPPLSTPPLSTTTPMPTASNAPTTSTFNGTPPLVEILEERGSEKREKKEEMGKESKEEKRNVCKESEREKPRGWKDGEREPTGSNDALNAFMRSRAKSVELQRAARGLARPKWSSQARLQESLPSSSSRPTSTSASTTSSVIRVPGDDNDAAIVDDEDTDDVSAEQRRRLSLTPSVSMFFQSELKQMSSHRQKEDDEEEEEESSNSVTGAVGGGNRNKNNFNDGAGGGGVCGGGGEIGGGGGVCLFLESPFVEEDYFKVFESEMDEMSESFVARLAKARKIARRLKANPSTMSLRSAEQVKAALDDVQPVVVEPRQKGVVRGVEEGRKKRGTKEACVDANGKDACGKIEMPRTSSLVAGKAAVLQTKTKTTTTNLTKPEFDDVKEELSLASGFAKRLPETQQYQPQEHQPRRAELRRGFRYNEDGKCGGGIDCCPAIYEPCDGSLKPTCCEYACFSQERWSCEENLRRRECCVGGGVGADEVKKICHLAGILNNILERVTIAPVNQDCAAQPVDPPASFKDTVKSLVDEYQRREEEADVLSEVFSFLDSVDVTDEQLDRMPPTVGIGARRRRAQRRRRRDFHHLDERGKLDDLIDFRSGDESDDDLSLFRLDLHSLDRPVDSPERLPNRPAQSISGEHLNGADSCDQRRSGQAVAQSASEIQASSAPPLSGQSCPLFELSAARVDRETDGRTPQPWKDQHLCSSSSCNSARAIRLQKPAYRGEAVGPPLLPPLSPDSWQRGMKKSSFSGETVPGMQSASLSDTLYQKLLEERRKETILGRRNTHTGTFKRSSTRKKTKHRLTALNDSDLRLAVKQLIDYYETARSRESEDEEGKTGTDDDGVDDDDEHVDSSVFALRNERERICIDGVLGENSRAERIGESFENESDDDDDDDDDDETLVGGKSRGPSRVESLETMKDMEGWMERKEEEWSETKLEEEEEERSLVMEEEERDMRRMDEEWKDKNTKNYETEGQCSSRIEPDFGSDHNYLAREKRERDEKESSQDEKRACPLTKMELGIESTIEEISLEMRRNRRRVAETSTELGFHDNTWETFDPNLDSSWRDEDPDEITNPDASQNSNVERKYEDETGDFGFALNANCNNNSGCEADFGWTMTGGTEETDLFEWDANVIQDILGEENQTKTSTNSDDDADSEEDSYKLLYSEMLNNHVIENSNVPRLTWILRKVSDRKNSTTRFIKKHNQNLFGKAFRKALQKANNYKKECANISHNQASHNDSEKSKSVEYQQTLNENFMDAICRNKCVNSSHSGTFDPKQMRSRNKNRNSKTAEYQRPQRVILEYDENTSNSNVPSYFKTPFNRKGLGENINEISMNSFRRSKEMNYHAPKAATDISKIFDKSVENEYNNYEDRKRATRASFKYKAPPVPSGNGDDFDDNNLTKKTDDELFSPSDNFGCLCQTEILAHEESPEPSFTQFQFQTNEATQTSDKFMVERMSHSTQTSEHLRRNSMESQEKRRAREFYMETHKEIAELTLAVRQVKKDLQEIREKEASKHPQFVKQDGDKSIRNVGSTISKKSVIEPCTCDGSKSKSSKFMYGIEPDIGATKSVGEASQILNDPITCDCNESLDKKIDDNIRKSDWKSNTKVSLANSLFEKKSFEKKTFDPCCDPCFCGKVENDILPSKFSKFSSPIISPPKSIQKSKPSLASVLIGENRGSEYVENRVNPCSCGEAENEMKPENSWISPPRKSFDNKSNAKVSLASVLIDKKSLAGENLEPEKNVVKPCSCGKGETNLKASKSSKVSKISAFESDQENIMRPSKFSEFSPDESDYILANERPKSPCPCKQKDNDIRNSKFIIHQPKKSNQSQALDGAKQSQISQKRSVIDSQVQSIQGGKVPPQANSCGCGKNLEPKISTKVEEREKSIQVIKPVPEQEYREKSLPALCTCYQAKNGRNSKFPTKKSKLSNVISAGSQENSEESDQNVRPLPSDARPKASVVSFIARPVPPAKTSSSPSLTSQYRRANSVTSQITQTKGGRPGQGCNCGTSAQPAQARNFGRLIEEAPARKSRSSVNLSSTRPPLGSARCYCAPQPSGARRIAEVRRRSADDRPSVKRSVSDSNINFGDALSSMSKDFLHWLSEAVVTSSHLLPGLFGGKESSEKEEETTAPRPLRSYSKLYEEPGGRSFASLGLSSSSLDVGAQRSRNRFLGMYARRDKIFNQKKESLQKALSRLYGVIDELEGDEANLNAAEGSEKDRSWLELKHRFRSAESLPSAASLVRAASLHRAASFEGPESFRPSDWAEEESDELGERLQEERERFNNWDDGCRQAEPKRGILKKTRFE